jgi:hypothetical protein
VQQETGWSSCCSTKRELASTIYDFGSFEAEEEQMNELMNGWMQAYARAKKAKRAKKEGE